MENLNVDHEAIANKVKDLFSARAEAVQAQQRLRALQQELGALIGESLQLEPTSLRTVSEVLDESTLTASGISESVDVSVDPSDKTQSMTKRLAALFVRNPDKVYTPEEAAEAIGDKYRSTHMVSLYTMARNHQVILVEPKRFRANRRNEKVLMSSKRRRGRGRRKVN